MQGTDEQVYKRFLAEGRDEDFGILLKRYRESLTMFLYGYVHNWEDAEDLMLDAFARTAAGETVFSGASSFKTWLFAIGRHLAMRHLRKQRVRLSNLEESREEDAASPEPDILRAERDVQLYQALDRLNPEYRQVLFLIYFEDMSREEVCRVMGKTRRQVYNLTERGRKSLREELVKMGFEYAQY